MSLKNVKTFLLDMDGTIFLGNKIIDGALAFLEEIKSQGKDFLLLTNNSSKNRYDYVRKLEDMGIETETDRIFTSGEASVIFLSEAYPSGKVFLLGTKSLEDEFAAGGFDIVNKRGKAIDYAPDFVVLGMDTDLTYEKVWAACDYISQGIPFYATHPDINCPIENGKYMPDAGAMIKMFEASTGVSPIIIGKPHEPIVSAVLKKYRLKKEDLAMVGDRLNTDISLGRNAGIISVLVYSGGTSPEDYADSKIRADYVFDSVKELKNHI